MTVISADFPFRGSSPWQKYHGQVIFMLRLGIRVPPIGRAWTGDRGLSKATRFVACLAMVGVGATIGTLAGGYSDAARSTDGAAERTTAARSATFSIAAVAAPPQTASRPSTPAANPATAGAAASIS